MAELDPGFSTAAMRAVWSNEARVDALIRVELALTEAAARTGLVPSDALVRIREAAASPRPDGDAVIAMGWRVGTPVITIVAWLRELAGSEAGRYVHFGATSQDILDTATVLQLRASFDALTATLAALADELGARMSHHEGDWVRARTLLQTALPMRLSARIARWLDPVLSELEALETARRSLPLQLGGPIGDLSTFGHDADTVVHQLGRALGLEVPRMPWHTDRAPIVDAVGRATAVARACATIASNLVLLSQSELAEARLVEDGAGRSSSMPDKRNAHHAVRAMATSRACMGAATIVTAAHPHELERATGSWQAEWLAVPLVMHTAAATVEATLEAVRAASFAATCPAPDVAPQDAHGEQLIARVAHRHRALRGPKTPWSCE